MPRASVKNCQEVFPPLFRHQNLSSTDLVIVIIRDHTGRPYAGDKCPQFHLISPDHKNTIKNSNFYESTSYQNMHSVAQKGCTPVTAHKGKMSCTKKNPYWKLQTIKLLCKVKIFALNFGKFWSTVDIDYLRLNFLRSDWSHGTHFSSPCSPPLIEIQDTRCPWALSAFFGNKWSETNAHWNKQHVFQKLSFLHSYASNDQS